MLFQDSFEKASIRIDNYELGVVKDYPNLGCNISEYLSLDSKSKRGLVSGRYLVYANSKGLRELYS